MTRRTARFLTQLYPSRWRSRFGEEFQTFLESRHVPAQEIVNVVCFASAERFSGIFPFLAFSGVTGIAVGGALYLAARGAPLDRTIGAHPVFWFLWSLIEAVALGMLGEGAIAAAPLLLAAIRTRRRGLLLRLAVPPGGVVVLLVWIGWISSRTGWTPVPWNIAATPPGLPSKTIAWLLAAFTVALLGSLLEASIAAIKSIGARCGFADSIGPRKLTFLSLAGAIVAMSVMAAGWGFLANRDDTEVFLGLGMSMSWLYWSILLSALFGAGISAALAAHRIFAGRRE